MKKRPGWAHFLKKVFEFFRQRSRPRKAPGPAASDRPDQRDVSHGKPRPR